MRRRGRKMLVALGRLVGWFLGQFLAAAAAFGEGFADGSRVAARGWEENDDVTRHIL